MKNLWDSIVRTLVPIVVGAVVGWLVARGITLDPEFEATLTAAEVRARTLKQDLARPLPEQLAGNLFTLEELTGLRDYPRRAARSAAFYWQAEALANALRRRLGPGEFQAFIGLVSVPQPPDWRVLLRERWYFSDWDMDWLAGQIQPAAGRQQL